MKGVISGVMDEVNGGPLRIYIGMMIESSMSESYRAKHHGMNAWGDHEGGEKS